MDEKTKLIFLATCILVHDQDGKDRNLLRKDSIAREDVRKAAILADFIYNVVLQERFP